MQGYTNIIIMQKKHSHNCNNAKQTYEDKKTIFPITLQARAVITKNK